jgi:hypothetical protein
MYGAKQTSDGKAISANGMNPILVGLCVQGNTIESLEMAKDDQGNVNPKRAVLTFVQKNGAKFQHSFWDSSEDWAIDQINREMLHICNKIVSEDEYTSVVDEHGDGTFQGFIDAVATNIIPKAKGKNFNLKIVYKENKNTGKWYPNFPKFPNFIEPECPVAETTFTSNPKYDVFTQPTATTMPDTPSSGTEEAEDFPSGPGNETSNVAF